MTQQQIDEIYAELAVSEKEIADHNQSIIWSLGPNAVLFFDDLIDDCDVTDKISFAMSH